MHRQRTEEADRFGSALHDRALVASVVIDLEIRSGAPVELIMGQVVEFLQLLRFWSASRAASSKASSTGPLIRYDRPFNVAVAAFGGCTVPTILADVGQHGLGCADVLYASDCVSRIRSNVGSEAIGQGARLVSLPRDWGE